MTIYLFTFLLMYFISLSVFVSNRKHLLIMLLSLELSVIALYIGLSFYMSSFSFESFFLLIFLTMSVCEGALGLSLLVLMIRMHSNDFVLTFTSLR